eukprot:TRINITY_DN8017_c0_g1_i1.p1 TRINITY_DN8017_c0_g1~~TRINITY_DN8017_c0_g1_i1.p1  ORF type:complete len:367 (+),score=52.15 TRINITY_DN8017_c0_g1_i1:47-1102(+)
MAQGADVTGVSLIEKDVNGDILVTWTQSGLEPELKKVVLACAQLDKETIPLQFTWTRYKTTWVHIYTVVTSGAPALPQTNVLSVVLLSSQFNPERYAAISALLANVYKETGSPVKVLEVYLSIFAKGKCAAGALGTYDSADFDPRKALLATPIKAVVKMFGLEIILLWNAIMMKKRIAIYSKNLGALLTVIRATPIFAWHRQNWNILRPFVTLTDAQLAELRSSGVYVAGFIDEDIKSKPDLFDLFVDVNARRIIPAPHSAEDFKMGAFHKELATYLVGASDKADVTDQALIKGLALKTKDLLVKLTQLKVKAEDGNAYITLQSLQQRKLPPHMDRFLFNIANAEGLTRKV